MLYVGEPYKFITNFDLDLPDLCKMKAKKAEIFQTNLE